MQQYRLINTIILPSFHDSGSCVIGLILVFPSKQKPHHIANITIFPISKSKYVIKRKLGNHFRNSKWIAFNNSTSFQVSCQNAIQKNGPTFANGTAAEFNIYFLNVNLDENYLVRGLNDLCLQNITLVSSSQKVSRFQK